MTFEDWLEREYSCHTPQEFTSIEEYNYWFESLRVAYESGWNACRDKWAGMTYDETVKYGFIK